ncbi:MAG: hypothetical protein AB1631_13140 [Acidobacteriota bacterium]
MTDSGKTLLLVTASLRSQLRWASRHLYAALVLTPIVVGMTYATASRFAAALSEWHPSPLTVAVLSVSLAVCLVALSLSQASAEIYHIRRPESSLDALPVSASSHLRAALTIRFVRASATSALILAAAIILGADLKKGALLLPFALLLATAQMLAALNWIHWNHRREKSSALAAIVCVAFASINAGMLLAAFARRESPLWLALASLVSIILLYLLLAFLHARWRASDLEYARRLKLSGRWNILSLKAFQKRLGLIVVSQLARDLQLTLRAFSSAVYVIAGLALLTAALLATALIEGWLPADGEVKALLDATWLPSVMAVKVACVIVTVCLVSLVPVLIAYELPLLWVERAIGTTGLDIWKAKLWYARLVSLPAAPLVWAAAMMTARSPLNYSVPLLLECAWLWWMVSSMSGAFAFEMPTRAGLSIVLMATIGLSAGAIAAMLWPIGLMIYGMSMHSLTARGRARTRYYLITEEE